MENLKAAMAHIEPETPSTNTESKPGKPADKQIIVRVTPDMADLWKEAAEKEGKSLSEAIRGLVTPWADAIVNCPHPKNMRQVYPWSETCLKCGKKLRAEEIKGKKASPPPPF